ncbi:MAG: methionyl-tRNA formyltransferase [Mycoplasmoidaceae bacterium]|nr:MAG: methionyl-tRNA formyltransferase [Mycoplasmoidaceae bacterium]
MTKKIIFLGTPKIAADILNTILTCDVEVIGVVCQPDRLGNRGKIVFGEVKALCLEKKLNLFQPNKTKEIINELKELKPDLIITCAYGEIVSESILAIPKYGCINIHTSLLPKYRGAAPINWVILNKEKQTGVTLMYMDKGMDTGDIIKQKKINIEQKETFTSLYDKLTLLGCNMIKDNINLLFSSNIKKIKQDNKKATFANKITREAEKISFENDAITIEHQVRALYEKPLCYATYKNIDVKILESDSLKSDFKVKCGEIVKIDKTGILVQTAKKTCLLIKKIQIPGKNPVLIKDYINGNSIFKIGERFN